MSGRFYAVGVGPGDPELITIKAVNIIKECDVIAVPKSGAKENMALTIAKEYIEGKEILECEMPMIKEECQLDKFHDKSAMDIGKLLEQGKNIAFLTIGDPAIYSTVMYVHKRLTKKGYSTAMIPGITSFCAAAASLNCALCERDDQLHIIPATYEKLDEIDGYSGTKILMKSGKSIMKVRDKLEDRHAMLVERATLPDEKIYRDMKNLNEASSYFSIVVVPREK